MNEKVDGWMEGLMDGRGLISSNTLISFCWGINFHLIPALISALNPSLIDNMSIWKQTITLLLVLSLQQLTSAQFSDQSPQH